MLLGVGYLLECGQSPRPTVLKKTDSPSLRNHQLRTGNVSPFPLLLEMWLACSCEGLVQQPQQLWVHECSGPVMFRRHFESSPFQPLALKVSHSLFHSGPWDSLGWVWYWCSFYDWLHLSLHWSVVSFFVNQCLLYRKSLWWELSGIDLWV